MSKKPPNDTSVKTPPKAGAASPPVQKSIDLIERRRFARPLPLPEIVEGDGNHDDWDTWVKLSQDQASKGDATG